MVRRTVVVVEPRHHALIAGTGRAGTSFLVRFLDACGVPCGDLDDLAFFDDANAGLERGLLDAGDTYLVKDPWFVEYMHQVNPAEIALDVLILPVRELRMAAMSRVRLERAHILSAGRAGADQRTWGNVPGGVLYSLGVQDQERVLAVGQAELITWALSRSVPMIMLHYPRLVTERDYLIEALWPWLSRFCDRATAEDAFKRIAAARPWATEVPADAVDPEESELVADLRVEIEALATANRRLVDALEARRLELEGVHLAHRSWLDSISARHDGLVRELEESRSRAAAFEQDLCRAQGQLEDNSLQMAHLEHERELAARHAEHLEHVICSLREAVDALGHEADALRRSRSYRLGQSLTAPVRTVLR